MTSPLLENRINDTFIARQIRLFRVAKIFISHYSKFYIIKEYCVLIRYIIKPSQHRFCIFYWFIPVASIIFLNTLSRMFLLILPNLTRFGRIDKTAAGVVLEIRFVIF